MNKKLDKKKTDLSEMKRIHEKSTMKGLHDRLKIAAVNSDDLLNYYKRTNTNVDVLAKQIEDVIVSYFINTLG